MNTDDQEREHHEHQRHVMEVDDEPVKPVF